MLELDGHTFLLDALQRVACDGEPCALAPAARERMASSRALVEKIAAEPRAVYGINTGFGPLSGFRVADEDQRQHQANLLAHLGVGQGRLFDARETRAVMAVRANALARGYSGIRPGTVDALLDLLNAGWLPEIPSEGSVGASGDLVPLAHMARALTGLGHARREGRRVPATEALAAINREPLVLECKEALALVNGTSVMTGVAALAVNEARAILGWLERFAAALFEVLGGEVEALCADLHAARGFAGQSLVAERVAGHLRQGERYARLIDEQAWGTHAKEYAGDAEIQDPYSLRCVPQVLGAFQEALWHVEAVVEQEMNASTDNPLAFPDSGMIVHGGNFYGQQIAMACDYLRIGLAKLALLADRQIERLVNWRVNRGLPPMLAGGQAGLNSGFAGAQLLATSLAAECRLLSAPASVQTIPTNANNQDVVSMGCISAKMTRELTAKLWTILSVQALVLTQAAELRGDPAASSRVLVGLVREVSAPLAEDRHLDADIAALRERLQRAADIMPPRPSHREARR